MKYTFIYLFLVATIFSVNANWTRVLYNPTNNSIVARYCRKDFSITVSKFLTDNRFRTSVKKGSLLENPKRRSATIIQTLKRQIIDFERTMPTQDHSEQ